MPLTRGEQTDALKYLLQGDYDGFGRLVEDSRSVSREHKIDLLYHALKLAGLHAQKSSSDEQVQEATEKIGHIITGGAEVVQLRPQAVNHE